MKLRNVRCWVSDGDLPSGVGDILLSRAIMYQLGYGPRNMLRDAAFLKSEYDMQHAKAPSGVVKAIMALNHELTDELAAEEEALVPLELDSCFPELQVVDAEQEKDRVRAVLDERVAEAKTAGCGSEFAAGLAKLLEKYVDVFRLTLGRDPPVKMPPLKVI